MRHVQYLTSYRIVTWQAKAVRNFAHVNCTNNETIGRREQ